MKISTMSWILGGALVLTTTGVSMVACSSSSTPAGGGGGGGTSDDGGGGDATGGGGGGGGGTDGGGGGGGGSDSGSTLDCGSTPMLHPSDGGVGSIFCGYDSNNMKVNCNSPTQQCCLGGKNGTTFEPDICVALGAGCTNGGPKDAGLAIPCEVTADCAGTGMICCGIGGSPTPYLTCPYDKEQGFLGSVCTQGTTCGGGQFQLCGADSECPTGQTCHAAKVKILQLGWCSP